MRPVKRAMGRGPLFLLDRPGCGFTVPSSGHGRGRLRRRESGWRRGEALASGASAGDAGCGMTAVPDAVAEREEGLAGSGPCRAYAGGV